MNRDGVPIEGPGRHRGLIRAAGLTVAAAAATAGIVCAAGADRQAWGVATAPFGWTRLVVIHAVSTLMLAWSLASIAATWQRGVAARRYARRWVLVGLMAIGLSVVAGSGLARLVDAFRSGYLARLSLRIVWCTALELPWCLATWAVIGPRCKGTPSKRRDRPGRRGGKEGARWSFSSAVNGPSLFSTPSGLALAIVTAVGVPLSFLAVFLEQETELARATWQRAELVATRRIVRRLVDVGSTASLGERPAPPGSPVRVRIVTPPRALAELDEAIALIGQRIEQGDLAADRLPRNRPGSIPRPANTARRHGSSGPAQRSARERIAEAQYYLALEQTPRARAVLEPIADHDPAAALLLARIAKRSGAIDRCRQWSEQALELARQSKPASASAADALGAIQLQAYEMLAVCAGEEADFERAERILLEAEQRLPRYRAVIHHRLGKHYAFIGDLHRAFAHDRQAAELDPDTYPPPESLLRRILSTGAPVGLARPKSSRYQ